MEHTGGDRVEGEIGDNVQQAAIGKDINTSAASGNVTNIHLPGWNPTVAHGQDEGRIPLEIEREFRQEFTKLTVAIVELRESVRANNSLTEQQIKLLQAQVENIQKIAEGTETKVVGTLSGVNIVPSSRQPLLPVWAIIFGIACLSLITIGVIAVVYFVAQGFG